jgi:fused signal recognition particle receptor
MQGGVVVSIVDELGIPIKFIGVGEKVSDLMLFDADEYVEALFPGN